MQVPHFKLTICAQLGVFADRTKDQSDALYIQSLHGGLEMLAEILQNMSIAEHSLMQY